MCLWAFCLFIYFWANTFLRLFTLPNSSYISILTTSNEFKDPMCNFPEQHTYLNQSEPSQVSPSCPLALSALHLHLPFNPQSLSPSLSLPLPPSPPVPLIKLHPLYQFLSLSIPLQTHMPSPLRGRLDSVTHHGASVRASLVLLLSSHTVCPSGLVFTELDPLRDDGKMVGEKKTGLEGFFFLLSARETLSPLGSSHVFISSSHSLLKVLVYM